MTNGEKVELARELIKGGASVLLAILLGLVLWQQNTGLTESVKQQNKTIEQESKYLERIAVALEKEK